MTGNLKEFQRGAEFAEGILVGIYSCLLVITLWRPTGTGRPTAIGWIIIAMFCLTLCRVAVDYRILGRTLFTGGALGSTDYVLRGLRHGFSFAATVLGDGLFCWRLYVIWSRSLRIVLLPAFLLAVNALSFVVIVVIDFVTASRPNDPRLVALSFPLFVAVQSVIVTYTCYITAFIASRLWSVGHAVDKVASLETPKGNRYLGAISALIQTGFIQAATRTVTIIIAVVNYSLVPTLGRFTVPLNGISATLLVLQLNMFQQKAQDHGAPPLTTGATFKFAGQEGSSLSESGERPRPPVARRRRASMSMAVYQSRGSVTDTQASGPLLVMFSQHKRSQLPTPDSSAISTVFTNK
ncbi:hypothetical protein FRB94_004676 [Tulasnella sp. JGI-2019a]|nr:hypothetical protein FRB94_004676 [Tulasnella sp. JGI-2019a]KAG9006346.1 hypothetical protein FRB93_008835 [Tulasnella sp. JGI-2019a]